jgi:hypothetical protein
VPTTQSAESFAKLVSARERLNEITRQLNELDAAHLERQEAADRYAALQAEWDSAFRTFQKATNDFAMIVECLPGKDLKG